MMIRFRQAEKRDGERVDPTAVPRRRPPPALLDARPDREDRPVPPPGVFEFRRWRDDGAHIAAR